MLKDATAKIKKQMLEALMPVHNQSNSKDQVASSNKIFKSSCNPNENISSGLNCKQDDVVKENSDGNNNSSPIDKLHSSLEAPITKKSSSEKVNSKGYSNSLSERNHGNLSENSPSVLTAIDFNRNYQVTESTENNFSPNLDSHYENTKDHPNFGFENTSALPTSDPPYFEGSKSGNFGENFFKRVCKILCSWY